MSSPAEAMRAVLSSQGEAHEDEVVSEMSRIMGLPIRMLITPEEITEVTRMFVRPDYLRDDPSFRLTPGQANGVLEFAEAQGLFGPISVGGGKTLLQMLCAKVAWELFHHRYILLLVLTSAYDQFVRNTKWARRRVAFPFRFIGLGGLSPQQRKSVIRERCPGVYLLPYSLLSREDCHTILETLKVTCILADEAHLLKNRGAARTRRLLEYIADEKPLVTAVSGTLAQKSITEYHKIARASLRDNCFLPLGVSHTEQWAAVLDSRAAPSDNQMSSLWSLVGWAKHHFPTVNFGDGIDAIRRSYQVRMTTSPGVVCIDDDIGVGILLDLQGTRQPLGEKAQALIDQVWKSYIAPNGDELDWNIQAHKWVWELSSGFYVNTIWPDPKEFAHHRGLTEEKARSDIARAIEHHEAKMEYRKLVRGYLKYSQRPGLDTPALVANNIKHHGAEEVGNQLNDAYWKMDRLKFPGMPKQVKQPILVDDYRLREAVHWAEQYRGKGLILWCEHIAFAEWAVQYLKEAGMDPFYGPAGMDIEEEISRDPSIPERPCVLAKAHGVGKNLQDWFERAVYLQWPLTAPHAEQSLGRLHRRGQEAEHLTFHVIYQTTFDKEAYSACLVDAVFVQQTLSTRQKIIYADYTNEPILFPEAYLRERGHQFPRLDTDMRKVYDGLWK